MGSKRLISYILNIFDWFFTFDRIFTDLYFYPFMTDKVYTVGFTLLPDRKDNSHTALFSFDYLLCLLTFPV